MKVFVRGHEAYWSGEKFPFRKLFLKETDKEVPTDLTCARCHLPYTVDGDDVCIARMPGIMFACCGHGHDESAYITFNDGKTIRGSIAVEIQRKIMNRKNRGKRDTKREQKMV